MGIPNLDIEKVEETRQRFGLYKLSPCFLSVSGGVKGTHRSIELSFLIHAQVESSIHPSDADQPHCQADEFQDTCGQKHTPINQQKPTDSL